MADDKAGKQAGRNWRDCVPQANAGRRAHWPSGGPWNRFNADFTQDMVIEARLGRGGDVRIEYGGIVATIKVQHEKASGQSPRFARKWRIENTY